MAQSGKRPLLALLTLLLIAGHLFSSNLAAAFAADHAPSYTVLQQTDNRLLVQLPNRLIVVAQRVETAPVVSAQVWVKTGSIYEQQHVGAGLSHFLEHLVSGGSTTRRTEAENSAILGRIGAQTNAATGLDTVRYYINTTAPYAHEAVDLLSDWLQNARITQAEFDRERQVIQREFEMGAGEPGRIFWKLTQQARYTSHPAQHPTIGYLEDFLQISRQQVYDFYKQMYVPNNMLFVVAGDIDPQATVDQIAKLWADAPQGPLPELSFPIEPPLDGQQQATATADIRQPRLRLAWPGTRLGGPGDYALDLLGVILGHGESSRLTRTIRDEQRLVNSIDAYNLSFAWGEGFFGIDAEIASGDEARLAAGGSPVLHVRGAILQEIERIKREGVTQQELARAKKQILALHVYGEQTVQQIASRLASDLINTGNPDYFDTYKQAIEKLTAGDLQSAAVRFLDQDRMITLSLLPVPEGGTPTELERAEPTGNVAQLPREEVNLDNAALADRLRALQVRDGQTRELATEPVRRIVLPNGLRVLVGRSTHVPAVAMQIYQVGGLLADQPGQEGLTNAMAEMRLKGTTTRTAEQIAQQVENLGAVLEAGCGYNTSYVRAVSLAEDWPVLLELIADTMTNPSFPDEEWAKLQPRLVAAIHRQNDSWYSELSRHFRQRYFGSHPWSHMPVGRVEQVGSLSVDQLRSYHQQRLGASDLVLAVFGDVEVDRVLQMVQQLFKDLPARPAQPFVAPQPSPAATGVEQVTTNKPLAAVQLGFGPGATRTSPDYPALRVLSNVISSFPSGMLEQELRGRGPGLVYAVGAGMVTGLVPGYFSITFNSQPANAAEATRRSLAVVEQLRSTSLEQVQLDRAKAAVLTDEFMAKQSNSDRAAEAALDELYGLGPDAAEQFLQDVQAITAADVQQAAKKYLNNPVVVVLTHQPLPAEELDSLLTPAPTAEPQAKATPQPAGK